jgi:hypothetical protein
MLKIEKLQKELGFKKVGQWEVLSEIKPSDSKLVWSDRKEIDHDCKLAIITLKNALKKEEKELLKNVIYAFVVGDNVKYIGKTTQGLLTRLRWYIFPDKNGHATNQKCNNKIFEALTNETTVEIWMFFSSQNQKYNNEYDLNLAAGLEDGLIKLLKKTDPYCWNGQNKKNQTEK